MQHWLFAKLECIEHLVSTISFKSEVSGLFKTTMHVYFGCLKQKAEIRLRSQIR